jgi:ABC-type lipoprotein release transport system permease subunit
MLTQAFLNIKIGFFLALRNISHASLWTTSLIVFVMVLTFLNLVVVSGILVGLIQGAVNQVRVEFTGDIVISALEDKRYIENSPNLISLVGSLSSVEALSPRYAEGVVLEANYKTRKETDKKNTANAQVYGVNPLKENEVTGLASSITEGEYLEVGDFDKILIGQFLLSQYVPVDDPNYAALDNVEVGSKVRISIGDTVKEVTVKGIINSKVDALTRNIFMVDSQLRSLIGRTDGNVGQIAVLLKKDSDPVYVKQKLIQSGADTYAKVQTFEDAQPQFLKDIVQTFNMLGTAFSSIGLVVASITIFIVVFINALTRRKYIGIMKGIGIKGSVIEISYVFQSIFYALLGSLLGLIIVYGFLVPYFVSHPIDFPFSDGILVAPLDQTLFRVGLLVIATLIAGYIPARMIVRRNTLDSILGRN